METNKAEGKRVAKVATLVKEEEEEQEQEQEQEEEQEQEQEQEHEQEQEQEQEDEEEDEEEEEEEEEEEDVKNKKRALTLTSIRASSAGGSTQPYCRVQDCTVDMTGAKPYHRRHKVCEFHARAPAILVAGLQQRFCQQCSRFHAVSEFDEAKKSCRGRLAKHNERRRKSSNDSL